MPARLRAVRQMGKIKSFSQRRASSPSGKSFLARKVIQNLSILRSLRALDFHRRFPRRFVRRNVQAANLFGGRRRLFSWSLRGTLQRYKHYAPRRQSKRSSAICTLSRDVAQRIARLDPRLHHIQIQLACQNLPEVLGLLTNCGNYVCGQFG
jgi:hypothetical protein